MRFQKSLVFVLLLAAAVTFLMNRFVFGKSATADDSKRKWEYCRVYGSSHREGNNYKAQLETASTPVGRIDEIDSNYTGVVALNNLGADGWELVAVIQSGGPHPEYILKRPKL